MQCSSHDAGKVLEGLRNRYRNRSRIRRRGRLGLVIERELEIWLTIETDHHGDTEGNPDTDADSGSVGELCRSPGAVGRTGGR